MLTVADLHPHLSERCRWVVDPSTGSETAGSFVLYWMRSAVRGHENPALDVARRWAVANSLPLLVYQGLSSYYPFASDRHHAFMLEGARDVQKELEQQGLSYAFHLERRRGNEKPLLKLTREASLLVTEDMPTGPPRDFLGRLVAESKTPILAVDTACVVPMRLTERPFTRAFAFRSATDSLYRDRVGQTWPETLEVPSAFPSESLPFSPIDFSQTSIQELIAQCEIDHSVGVVVDTKGGTAAGYERWEAFRDQGLKTYAKRRNNPLAAYSVSRMSPYLHYGMVSPMRIAREAQATGGEGGKKYLDELLIWRELAYHFCFHRQDHETWAAIPDWAQKTLQRHQTDIRGEVFTWEQLARGETGDALWDSAQQSLVRHGELHNNVRMTWGKAILQWTRSPQDALQMMIDLNHRYALDGRDPASYGGILWCLGQFDRPFEPEKEILGTVRPRPTHVHTQRLDVERYRSSVLGSRFKPCHVAVIGAGISGLAAARTLADHGLKVTVFDKSRGLGGRMSTRRVDGVPTFDHGAQFFSAVDPVFRRYLDSWIEQGLVAQWRGIFVQIDDKSNTKHLPLRPRFVATPTMNAICKHLGRELDIRKQVHIKKVIRSDSRLGLATEDEVIGDFDWVVTTAPAEQSADLLSEISPLEPRLREFPMSRCWALMVSLSEEPALDWVAAELTGSFLVWVSRNQTKPGRPDSSGDWIVHAGPQWTLDHWENDPQEVALLMFDELQRVLKTPLESSHRVAHRWKYALANGSSEAEQNPSCLVDGENRIIAAGDWCRGGKVEAAFLSGLAAAGRIVSELVPTDVAPRQSRLF